MTWSLPDRGRHAAPYRLPTRALWPVLLAGTGLLLGSQAPEPITPKTSLASGAPAGEVALPALASPVLYPLDPQPPSSAPRTATAAVTLPQTATSRSIPPRVLEAYVRAANQQRACGMTWSLLAGIGWIESHHARGGGSHLPTWDGVAKPAILGPRLDGNGPWATIGDSDRGELDGDPRWDRAAGPMQFIPSTWRRWGSDGNSDGRRDPQSIDDAALSAARYLCASGDLRGPAGLYQAVFSYNHSVDYVRAVLATAQGYAGNEAAAAVLRSVGTAPAGVAPPRPVATTPRHQPIGQPDVSPTPMARPAASPTPAPGTPPPTAPAQTDGPPVPERELPPWSTPSASHNPASS